MQPIQQATLKYKEKITLENISFKLPLFWAELCAALLKIETEIV